MLWLILGGYVVCGLILVLVLRVIDSFDESDGAELSSGEAFGMFVFWPFILIIAIAIGADHVLRTSSKTIADILKAKRGRNESNFKRDETTNFDA